MTAGRAVAVVVAAVMIVGAWFVRDRVLDDNEAGTDTSNGTVVCVKDLEDACRAVEDDLGIDIRIESVDDTIEAWGSADEVPNEVWITMAPFPEMAESVRTRERLAPADAQVEVVASSPLTLVANADIAAEVARECDDPVSWECLGSGSPDVRVGFAPFPHTAIGQVGVTSAALGFGGGELPTGSDLNFTVWARQISSSSDNGSRTPTAISTIQTRPSRFDIAVGAAAELVDPAATEFVLLTLSDSSPIDVVVATPEGTSAPIALVAALRTALTNAGWTDTQTASNTLTPSDMLAVREIWKDYL